MFIKQDKGGGILVSDRKHYIEKCLNILEVGQFKKLEKDPTKTIESKMKIRKIKNYFDEK